MVQYTTDFKRHAISERARGFTTTSEKQSESSLSVSSSAVGAKSRRGFTTTNEGQSECSRSVFLSAGVAKPQRGFTLIELLVVIAIIGVLAAVVLASLNQARERGSDASAASSLNNSRAQSELFFHDNSNVYEGVCTDSDEGINQMLQGAMEASRATSVVTTDGTAGTLSTVICHDSDTAWAAAAPLFADDDYYCVDSTGFGGVRTNPLAGGAYVCPSS